MIELSQAGAYVVKHNARAPALAARVREFASRQKSLQHEGHEGPRRLAVTHVILSLARRQADLGARLCRPRSGRQIRRVARPAFVRLRTLRVEGF